MSKNKMNYKYLWVSKRLFEVPVLNEDGSLTNIKQTVVERKGRTYTRPEVKPESREDERRENFRTMGWTKTETDLWRRADKR